MKLTALLIFILAAPTIYIKVIPPDKAVLVFTPPTQDINGQPLTGVTHYRAYWKNYNNQSQTGVIELDPPYPVGSELGFDITDKLPHGAYLMTARAYNNSGESGDSNEILVALNKQSGSGCGVAKPITLPSP